MTAAKFAVALLGEAAGIAAVAVPILPERYRVIALIIIGAATAAGVYQVPNKPNEEERQEKDWFGDPIR